MDHTTAIALKKKNTVICCHVYTTILPYLYKYTDKQTYIHTYTHTYIYTYIHISKHSDRNNLTENIFI